MIIIKNKVYKLSILPIYSGLITNSMNFNTYGQRRLDAVSAIYNPVWSVIAEAVRWKIDEEINSKVNLGV